MALRVSVNRLAAAQSSSGLWGSLESWAVNACGFNKYGACTIAEPARHITPRQDCAGRTSSTRICRRSRKPSSACLPRRLRTATSASSGFVSEASQTVCTSHRPAAGHQQQPPVQLPAQGAVDQARGSLSRMCAQQSSLTYGRTSAT